MQNLNLSEIVLPFKGMGKVDYFKVGVLWVLAGDKKPSLRKAKKGEKSTLENPEIVKAISEAVPGQNSYLMDLTIRSNINEYVIYASKYTLEEKIDKVADSISSFVVV